MTHSAFRVGSIDVITWTRVHGTRFYRVDFPGGHRAAAIVDDFGNLVFVTLRVPGEPRS